jgi:orotate phosphoribosyltransferase
VILVDDVYTTGTTVTECAKVLRRAGTTKVWVATAARTLKLASNYEGFESLRRLAKVSMFQSFKVSKTKNLWKRPNRLKV